MKQKFAAYILLALAGMSIAQKFWEWKLQVAQAGLAYFGALVFFIIISRKQLLRFSKLIISGKITNDLRDTRSLRLAIVILVVSAIFFRIYKLDSIPLGILSETIKQAEYSNPVSSENLSFSPYFTPSQSNRQFETLHSQLNAPLLNLLGHSVGAVRICTLIWGLLSLLVFSYFIFTFFGARVCLVSTILLAFSGVHIIQGRTGLRVFSVPVFELISIFCLFKAFNSRFVFFFFLSSLFSVLATYMHPLGRFVLLKQIVFSLYFVLSTSKISKKGLLLLVSSYVLLSAPLINYALAHWDSFRTTLYSVRFIDLVNSGQWPGILYLLKNTLLSFNLGLSSQDVFGFWPLLDYPQAVLFIIGVIISFFSLKEFNPGFLIIWWLLSILPASLGQATSQELISALFPAIVLGALGLEYLLYITRRLGFIKKLPSIYIILILELFLITSVSKNYFIPTQRRSFSAFDPDSKLVADFVSVYRDKFEFYISSKFNQQIIEYLASNDPSVRDQIHMLQGAVGTILAVHPRSTVKGLALITEDSADNTRFQKIFSALYPGSESHVINDYSTEQQGRLVAKVVLVPTSSIAKRLPLETAYKNIQEAEQVKINSEPKITYTINAFEGGQGYLPGEFDNIMGIAIDSKGFIYAVDMANHRLQKFAADGKYLASIGGKGSMEGEFSEPRGIAIDENNIIYVMDTWNSRVQKFDSDLKYLGEIRSPRGFYGAKGVAARNGKIYVSDAGNGAIEAFNYSGEHLTSWGAKGNADGEFSEPVGLTVDKQGFIYVVDSANDRIQKFDQNGNFVAKWQVDGWNSGGLKEVYIEYGSDDLLYLADTIGNTILVYSLDGRLVKKLQGFFQEPAGIALKDGFIYVSERHLNRIKKEKL